MMNYSLKNLITKYQVKAKKSLGQNWLIDLNIIKKITQIISINNQEVVEIGPGLGALTFFLLKEAPKVIVYEIDDNAVEILKQEFNQEIINHKLIIYHQDILTAKFSWTKPKILFSNIPYYITSDLIFLILSNHQKFSQVILMVQDEVANRLVAKVGTKDYSKLTVSVNYFADVKKHFIVKPQHFLPQPKVNSAIISLTFKSNISFDDAKPFLDFIKNCFAFRRKTLFNNLKKIIQDEHQLLEIFTKLRLKVQIRPQEVSISTFLELYNHVK